MKTTVYLFLSIFLMACVPKAIEEPEDLIPKDQMVDLLVDMYIATKTRNIKTVKLEKNKNYMSFVFEKHKIDSTRFKASNEYYLYNTDKYQDIYKLVNLRIKDSLNKYEKPLKKKDSINKANRKNVKIKEKFKKNQSLKKTKH
jgi:hypothetical protein